MASDIPLDEESYQLGALVEAYPLNTSRMKKMLLLMAALTIPIMIGGFFTWRSGDSLVDEFGYVVPLALIVMISILGLGWLIHIVSQTKSLRAILDPPPELSSKRDIVLMPFFLVAAVIFIFKPGLVMMIAPVVGLVWSAIIILVITRRHRGEVVREFEQGITVPVKGEEIPIRWEQINAVWAYRNEGYVGRYDDVPVRIEGHWLNSNQLLNNIQRKVGERLYNEMLEQYNAGETISFGRIKVNQQGIIRAKTTYRWQDVEQVVVNQQGVCVRQGLQTRRIPDTSPKDIPNLNLLLLLTSHILSPTKEAKSFPTPITESPAAPEVPKLPSARPISQPLQKVREHRPAIIPLVFNIFCFAFGMSMAVASEVYLSRDYIKGTPLFTTYFGGFVALLALYKLIAWFQSFGIRVEASEDGLIYTRFGQTVVLNWEDVQTLKMFYIYALRFALVHRYTLESRDGRVIHLRQGLNKIGMLGDYIVKQVTAVLSPRAAKRAEKGEVVQFGQWGISQQGIHDSSRILPWDAVYKVRRRPRAVLVMEKGNHTPWTRIPVIGTPNLDVFLMLLGHYTTYESPSFRVS